MILLTQRDLIKTVAQRWSDQYYPFLVTGEPQFIWKDGKLNPAPDKAKIHRKLVALPENATVDDVTAIIGNDTWTRLRCDECKELVDSLIVIGTAQGDIPGYTGECAGICPLCFDAAIRLFDEYAARMKRHKAEEWKWTELP